jgi:hypothetical protein
VETARLDDDSAKGKHFAAALVSWVDLGGFIAEANNRCPLLVRGFVLGVNVLRIDAKAVLSREVPSVERHICILVGGWDVLWARDVGIHHKIERMIDEMSKKPEFWDASYLSPLRPGK